MCATRALLTTILSLISLFFYSCCNKSMSEILTWDSISVSIRKLIEEIFAEDWKQKRQQLGDVLSSSKPA